MMPSAILRDMRSHQISFQFDNRFLTAGEAIAQGLIYENEQAQLQTEVQKLGWGKAQ